RFVGLLLGSIVFNYGAGYLIGHSLTHSNRRAKLLLITSIIANLSLLGYFKYANFFVDNLNSLTGSAITMAKVFLPLGISFFTFTQLAFLVDTYQGKVKEYNFVHYTLFVTYFPHLIAGPVLHHKEMMPQFANRDICRFNYDNAMVGLIIFFIGLFKKVVLADSIASYVSPVFSSTTELSFLDAWGGALCYSLQLYFDFSGYSDMAIGLSRLFGVTLPLNFHSPYKAVNIIEFWRRWHITLSRFLRDYLYIPLGGNRYGKSRRYFNLILTMLLGGLWHGAGWTYLLWGGLHGVYLVINHGWHGLRRHFGQNPDIPLPKPLHAVATLLTFLAVVLAWVIFRSENVNIAMAMLKAMAGFNGFVLPEIWLEKWGRVGQFLSAQGVDFSADPPLIKGSALNWIWGCLLIVWFAPNTQQIMANFKPALVVPDDSSANHLLWQPSYPWLVVSVVCAVSALLSISKLSEFIYFQF
ncbi:MAG: MBOAT family protein, partial [Methylococcales bacterium]